MEALPSDVEQALVRGLSAYMKATPRAELPAKLKPLRDWRPQDLARRKKLLLGWLDDGGFRARVAEWLSNGRTPLHKGDRELLRLVSERPEGWHEQIAARARPEEAQDAREDEEVAAVHAELARAREQIRKLKDELRTARERAEATARAARLRLDAVQEDNSELERALADSQDDAAAARAETKAAQKRLEQTERKARARVDKAAEKVAKALEGRKEAVREAAELRRSLAAARRDLKARAAEGAPRRLRKAPHTRHVLAVPQGRFEDDPMTLEEWLKSPNVHVVVDGYNVTRAEGGFGDLGLAAQRDLLYEKLVPLARRLRFKATIVWDGSDPPVGSRRLPRGPVRVEYSEPARNEHHRDRADDHIVALIEGLPNYPVVLVTNDSGLRARTHPLKVTTATSQQLLALLSHPAKN